MLGKTDKKDQIGSVDQRPLTKGQLISKANCQAMNSSKKNERMNFVFTSMRHTFIGFLEEIEDS